MLSYSIRPIQPKDNVHIAKIIRDTLKEHGANKPGTVYYDDSTDHLYEVFDLTPASCYFIAEGEKGEVLGGGGIYPTPGLNVGTAEMVKLYLKPEGRGYGVAKAIILKCEQEAVAMGYTHIYLESMPELSKAVTIYEKIGYTYLTEAQGNSGHCGCDIWMIKQLEAKN
jgi:putative acetyltransferase